MVESLCVTSALCLIGRCNFSLIGLLRFSVMGSEMAQVVEELSCERRHYG
jgi:hypothetical protein